MNSNDSSNCSNILTVIYARIQGGKILSMLDFAIKTLMRVMKEYMMALLWGMLRMVKILGGGLGRGGERRGF